MGYYFTCFLHNFSGCTLLCIVPPPVPVRPASPLPPGVPTGPRNQNKYKDRDGNAPAVDGLDYGGTNKDVGGRTPSGEPEDRSSSRSVFTLPLRPPSLIQSRQETKEFTRIRRWAGVKTTLTRSHLLFVGKCIYYCCKSYLSHNVLITLKFVEVSFLIL